MSDIDLFGDLDEPFSLTRTQVIEYLKTQVCSENEPWVSNVREDHGHTFCYYIGTAISMLEEGPTNDQR